MKKTKQIDINSLTEEQFIEVETSLKKKVSSKIEKTVKDMNKHLATYGLEIVIGARIVKKGEANLIKEGKLDFTPSEG